MFIKGGMWLKEKKVWQGKDMCHIYSSPLKNVFYLFAAAVLFQNNNNSCIEAIVTLWMPLHPGVVFKIGTHL